VKNIWVFTEKKTNKSPHQMAQISGSHFYSTYSAVKEAFLVGLCMEYSSVKKAHKKFQEMVYFDADSKYLLSRYKVKYGGLCYPGIPKGHLSLLKKIFMLHNLNNIFK
jgi:hypothetical protein